MPSFETDPGLTQFLRPYNADPSYDIGQHNPFFENAWEQYTEDGTPFESDSFLTAEGSELIIGWGNYWEPAGYSPGRFSRGAARTGMLVDETTWTWDTSAQLDLQSPENNALDEYTGMLFLMIYCDEQLNDPVYFLGRFFRQEPGTS